MILQTAVGKNIYTKGVKIGNYVEDRKLEESKIDEFLEKKDKGDLSTLRTHEIIVHSRQKATLSCIKEDEYLRFGDMVLLQSFTTHGVLSSDFGDEISVDEKQRTFAVTTSSTLTPQLRNVFVIERPNEEDLMPDDLLNDVLHYGQNFCLRAHPNYTTTPYYLSSVIVTPQLSSRFSRQQLVFLTDVKSYHCCWRLLHKDPLMRDETDGEPVKAENPDGSQTRYIVTHSHSGIHLAADNILYANIFGNEKEVFCKRDLDHHRAETEKNHWGFIVRRKGE
ncbi:putative cilia- and flagella-associated protein 161 [Monocercomonoides exilis]|uniref:putative cilia- and flagella-associated protein 161 n=1 Tax=Monocercomonoides exilis TaxID=2049356 RepID=UPI003559576D|nr:putative cilia- and flagella-associated protein 161 [Monocercomonoides exilis]|eukprot:MONOS_12246.1-p1 / transcript=MONOS_12246.1 / gene=MONOS_12246 / organism=Monocercomonoides_exilis_PA203 / gene_product=uncharacterized protein LOC496017 / transcript_product=uncharacterized protein LOC496017 / location=Mono_scaffold00665:1591-2757(+) / protein_length=278 / sequence_SO=supercontig / SO=protein_coding / is_pseudo=false